MVVPFTVVGPSDGTNAMPQILMASRNLRGLRGLQWNSERRVGVFLCVCAPIIDHPPFVCTDIQLRNSLVL